MDIDYLEQAIGAMLMAKVITFEANSWAFGFVDMVVKSTVFVEPESIISVVEYLSRQFLPRKSHIFPTV